MWKLCISWTDLSVYKYNCISLQVEDNWKLGQLKNSLLTFWSKKRKAVLQWNKDDNVSLICHAGILYVFHVFSSSLPTINIATLRNRLTKRTKWQIFWTHLEWPLCTNYEELRVFCYSMYWSLLSELTPQSTHSSCSIFFRLWSL